MTNDQENTPAPTTTSAGCLKTLLAVACLGPVLVFVASQLGRYSFLCELISNFQQFILLSLLPTPLIFYRLQMKRMAFAATLATVWSLVIVAWVYLPAYSPSPGEQKIRVMSFNVLTNNAQHADVLEVIRENDPDVLLILEYSSHWINPLKVLEDRYPYRVTQPRWHGYGIALFSKLPISQSSIIQLAEDRSDTPAIVAQLQIGDRSLHVVGIHAASPVELERMQTRNVQFQDIGAYLADSNSPTLLMGDFNCTTWSPFLRDLMKKARLRDSRQGFGYLASWNAKDWPFQIPIDHALISDHIHVHDRSVGDDSAGSDHFPIFVEISISPE